MGSVDGAVDAILRLNPHPGCYARARYLPESGKWEFPIVKRPLTRELAEQHVRGKAMLGAVASDEEGYTDSVGLDLDAHLAHQRPGAACKKIAQVADSIDLPVVVHASKSGRGAHVRTLFSERVPTHLARALYVSLVIASGLSGDKAVDKVWPPTQGLGVLALPYNAKVARSTGGSMALNPWTLMPLQKDDQVVAVTEADEVSRDDLERSLVALGVKSDDEARLLAGCTAGKNGAWQMRQIKNEQDGGVDLMYDHCVAVRRLITEATTVPYHFWYSMLSNFRPFRGGLEIFREICRLDPARYDERKLIRMWESVAGGPRRCENLEPGWVCPHRANCPARSPAGLPFHVSKQLPLPPTPRQPAHAPYPEEARQPPAAAAQ